VGGWGCVGRAQTGAEERENTAEGEGQIGGLNASNMCMCSGSVEGGQKKPLRESQ